MRNFPLPPVVLVIAGNDPCGGAGLAADVQAVTALGAHPAPVAAALTVQDTRNVNRVLPVDPEFVREQARCVLEDMPVAAVKLGLLGSAAVGDAVAGLLASRQPLPLVIDPVLRASGGGVLAEEALIDTYLRLLFPHATLVTPNSDEGRRLAPQASDGAGRAAALLATGARYVLMKGADDDTPEVHNTLYGGEGGPLKFTWPRLPGIYHGSGCTLASAIAARLAHGQPPVEAVRDAQQYTWETLRRGWKLGRGQLIPDRQVRP